MNRLVWLLVIAMLFWAGIAYFFGGFLSRAETVQFVAVWSGLTLAVAGVLAAIALAGARVFGGRWPSHPELWALVIWIPLAVWLAQYIISLRPLIVEFQGISNLSTCKQAIGVVMDYGFEPADTEPDFESDGTWYVFDNEDEPDAQEISVRCRDEMLLNVSASALPEIDAAQRIEPIDLHKAVLESLIEDYGETEIVPILDGYGSRWCFSDDLPDSWRRRMFLVEEEIAELYVMTRQEDPFVEELRIDTGLLFESTACAAREADTGGAGAGEP
jgi:hypothetical protein